MKIERADEFQAYHNGSYSSGRTDTNGRKAKSRIPVEERDVLMWDMEGISLSGQNAPQHPVLFGCSAATDNPLIDKKLTSWDMLNYIVDMGEKYPDALHIGFGFRYDGNMLLQDFPRGYIERLYRDGTGRIHSPDNREFRITWIPGKRFTVTRMGADKARPKVGKVSVTIDDFSSFFGGAAFLKVAEQLLKDELTPEDHEVIRHGKEQRGQLSWEQFDEILRYWRLEITLMQRTFVKFRAVMVQAGFPLADWYGPGALANFINRMHNIRPHLVGAQHKTGDMPDSVHEASKRAFSGGRFELFKAGRHVGPIFAIDINSAYPYALTGVPSLSPTHGFWQHKNNPTAVSRFGVYRLSFEAPGASAIEYRPMPLFFRDERGLISYPNRVHGWYWSPEARMVLDLPGVTIHEGWEWVQTEEVYPWTFLNEMFETRQRLGKSNLLSMPFKLGPNSLYGKYAQTVGWDQKKNTPPRSHALPIAGWVTSYCRSMLWSIIRQIPDDVIAVETDSVYTTVDPNTLDIAIGSELGQWDYAKYNELLYVQSGMYHYRVDDEWVGTRSRGLGRTEFTAEAVGTFLKSLVPGEEWQSLTVKTRPRFIGAGAALANPFTFRRTHCSWRSQERVISFGDTGKRRLFHSASVEYQAGVSPFERPYRLAVASSSDGVRLSAARRLPWEREQTAEVTELLKGIDEETDTQTLHK